MACSRIGAAFAAALLGGVIGLAPTALAQEDADEARLQSWRVRLARMEGASVNVEEAATALISTTNRITERGRMQGMSDLSNAAQQLNRRVVSLTLATQVLREDKDAL
jgi:hypothetical protein